MYVSGTTPSSYRAHPGAAPQGGTMPTVEVPQGRLEYRAVGPADSGAPPVVFAHGLLVDGRLWTGVADRLAAAGIRSYAPDLPLGSHRIALGPDADLSPRGVARLLLDF